MHAAVFSRGEGRAMGSVLEQPVLNQMAAMGAIDSAQTALTLRRRGETMTTPRSGEVGMRNEIQ